MLRIRKRVISVYWCNDQLINAVSNLNLSLISVWSNYILESFLSPWSPIFFFIQRKVLIMNHWQNVSTIQKKVLQKHYWLHLLITRLHKIEQNWMILNYNGYDVRNNKWNLNLEFLFMALLLTIKKISRDGIFSPWWLCNNNL